MTVRPAGPEDLDALLASVDGLFAEDGGVHDPHIDVRWPARDGRAYYAGLLDDPACLLALAWSGDTVAGHLVGKLVEPDSIRLVRFAVLESMRVDPAYRDRGVGGQLVVAFFDWARSQEAVTASVTAFAANDGAQRFYVRHGFAPQSITLRAPV